MRLFDAHCHLQDPRITHCLEDTLNATEVQGVQQFACNGTSEDDWPQGRSDKWLDNLRKQLEEVPQAGLGECGLDTSKKVQTPIHEQEEVFKAQLELGKELQRPISVTACYCIYASVTMSLTCCCVMYIPSCKIMQLHLFACNHR
ncbi:TPA: Catalyzes the hydrolysis of D-tyrosyl-tRNA(Tyr), variant 2 [Trebouxia sp. C0004]